jgi:hypothetical protein
MRVVHVVVALAIATTAGAQGAQGAHKLVPVQRYGWASADEGKRPITPAERALSGARLGNVGGIVEGVDGALYVLDNLALKVVVFNRDGSLRRVFGPKGAAPGALDYPRSIALSDAGELFVLEQTLSRITVFDTAGAFKRTITLGIKDPLHLLITHDRVYVDRVGQPGQASVLGYDLKGALVDKLIVPTAEEEAFARAGQAYALARARNGAALIAYPNPGTWSSLSDPGKRFGRAIVANNTIWQHPTDKSVLVAPASMRGFGEMENGTRLIYFMQYDPITFKPPYNAALHYNLAILKSDGTGAETLQMGSEFRHLLAISHDGKELFLAVTAPFPQVIRFRLEGP